MRELTAAELEDISVGAGVLGTGGGGDPYLGKLAALRALEDFGPPKVIEVAEVPLDGLVALPVMVGAPLPMIEKLSFGPELVSVYDALTQSLGEELVALMSPEIGGVNSIVPLALGARVGLPVVDADGMGRAFPEIQQITLTLHGISATPFALADERGNTVVLNTVDNFWTERLARALVIHFGAICPGMGYPITGRQLREAAILGSLSYAEEIGRRIREARRDKRDAVEEILDVTRGRELFKGKIVDVDRRTEKGWTLGEATVEGSDEWLRSRMTVRFQNENLIADLDGDVIATVPDLITILGADTGEAITTERLRYGFRVVVLGIPCDKKWRSEEGISLVGPRNFGYDVDYVPVESALVPRRRAK